MRGNGISYWISWILLGANDGNCWQMVAVLWHLKWLEDVWKCLNRFCIILLTGNSHVFILGFCMFDLQCRIPNITWRLTGWVRLTSWQLGCDSARCNRLAAVSAAESSSHGTWSPGTVGPVGPVGPVASAAAFKVSNKGPHSPSLVSRHVQGIRVAKLSRNHTQIFRLYRHLHWHVAQIQAQWFHHCSPGSNPPRLARCRCLPQRSTCQFSRSFFGCSLTQLFVPGTTSVWDALHNEVIQNNNWKKTKNGYLCPYTCIYVYICIHTARACVCICICFFHCVYCVYIPNNATIAIALLTISDVPWLPCCSHTPPGTKSLIGHPLRPFPREKPSVELLCWQRQGPWMPRVGIISGLEH